MQGGELEDLSSSNYCACPSGAIAIPVASTVPRERHHAAARGGVPLVVSVLESGAGLWMDAPRSRHGRRSASRTIPRDILEDPARRSRKTIGSSRTTKPHR